MAITKPIPAPPRTPTPPPDDELSEMAGLGLNGIGDLLSPTHDGYDLRALSPMNENFTVNRYNNSISSPAFSSQPLSPSSPNSQYNSILGDGNGSNTGNSSQHSKGPFNFQPMSLAKSPITKSVGTTPHRDMECNG